MAAPFLSLKVGGNARAECRRQFSEAKDLVVSGRLAAIIHELENVRGRASHREIAGNLALLVQAFPYPPKTNLTSYGQQLMEDVCFREPSLFALYATCGELRRKSRFLPAIGDVISTIDEYEKVLAHRIQNLRRLPAAIADFETKQRDAV